MSNTKWNSSGLATFAATNEVEQDTINDTLEIGCPPIGSIAGWAKSISGVPSLPAGWAECDGSTVSDSESPYNGVALPNLNGSTEATKRFLRGNSTSGGTGGNATHSHPGGGTGANASGEPGPSPAANIPPYYEVVFIIRIK